MSVKKKRERREESDKERGGVGERQSAEFDQYSNCKMNLTGARTSHQMGKEIGYERWPAIKSDIPQCHLSDSGRGIMATANESWAPVRRRFKSAPCSGRLALLTQCLVLCPTQAELNATDQKRGKPFTLSQTLSWMNKGSCALQYYSGLREVSDYQGRKRSVQLLDIPS